MSDKYYTAKDNNYSFKKKSDSYYKAKDDNFRYSRAMGGAVDESDTPGMSGRNTSNLPPLKKGRAIKRP